MSENFYAILLGVDDEILQPDYYQLLGIDVDAEQLSPELVEEKYKVQMGKAQKVRTPKYKDLIEFLKGELRNAKRTLESPELVKKYNLERGKEVAEKVRTLIDTFIQISGDLSEIEMHEIRHQARILNCPKRMTEGLIDEQLRLFGKKRTRASAEQMARASEIMQKRAQQRSALSSERVNLLGTPGGGSGDAIAVPAGLELEPEDTRVRRMSEVAEELQRSADRSRRYGPAFIILKYVNLLLALVAWLGLIGLLVYTVAPGALESTIEGQFGHAGLHFFYGKNVEADAAVKEATDAKSQAAADVKAAHDEVQSLRDDRAAVKQWVTDAQREIDFSADVAIDDLRGRLVRMEDMFGTLRDRLRDAGESISPVQQMQLLLAGGKLDTALKLARDVAGDAAEQTPVTEFARNVLIPADLQRQSRWAWEFNPAAPLDFRNAAFRNSGSGLAVSVPADGKELVWAFGAAMEAGVVELEGEWSGNTTGSFGLEFWHRDGEAPVGMATLEAGQLRVDVGSRNHIGTFSGTANSAAFRLRLQVAKETDLEIGKLNGKVKAEYEQDGLRPAAGSTIKASAGSTDEAAQLANGRLAFHFPPGCNVVLKKLTVR